MITAIEKAWFGAMWMVTRNLFHTIIGIAIVLTTLVQTNAFPLVVGFCWLVYIIGAMILSDKVPTLLPGSDTVKYWMFGGLPLLAVIASLFVFVPFPFNSYQVIDKGNGDVMYKRGMFMERFNPFIDKVRNYEVDQTVTIGDNGHDLSCTGTTSNGKGLTALVSATLTLPFEGLHAAYEKSDNQNNLAKMERQELCTRFTDVIKRYSITQIPSNLAIESNTADETHGMNSMGVRYAGVITVDNMHAYVIQ